MRLLLNRNELLGTSGISSAATVLKGSGLFCDFSLSELLNESNMHGKLHPVHFYFLKNNNIIIIIYKFQRNTIGGGNVSMVLEKERGDGWPGRILFP